MLCRLWRGVCERCRCRGVGIDCSAVYVSGVGVVVNAVVCARLPFLDEEPFAMLSGKTTQKEF